MKKTVKFLLTGILTFTSLGLASVNNKDVKNGFVESTNDIVGEKINVGKKNAKSTTTTDDFVVGESLRITNAVAQRKVDDKGTTVRFVAAAKAENLADGIIGGELGFHVRYNRSETEVVNKYVAVESVYKSMVAGDTTYTNTKMGDFLVSTGLGEASNPNGYDVFITYSITEIPSTHLNTEFEVQPFFMKTGEGTREFASGTKKANATGYTLKVGNGNAVSLKDATKPSGEIEYKATITAGAGDVVSFYVDGKKLTSRIDIKENDKAGCNALDKGNGDFEIRTAIEDQEVYLKQYGEGESAWYNVWVEGYVEPDPVNGATVKIGSLDAVEMKEVEPDDPNMVKQYSIKGVKVAAGDKLVFTVDGKVVTPGASGDGNNAKADASGLTIVSAGEKVNIYLKVYARGYDVWVSKDETTPIIPGTKTTVYFVNVDGWEEVYAYCWNDANVNNGGWPGEAMTKLADKNSSGLDVYEYTIDSSFTMFKFNNNNKGIETGNFSVSDVKGDNIYYDLVNNNWVASANEVVGREDTTDYLYVRGSHSGWNCQEEYKLVKTETKGIYSVTVNLVANTEFKLSNNTPSWDVQYGGAGAHAQLVVPADLADCFDTTGDNIKVLKEGKYTFTFDEAKGEASVKAA